MPHAITIPDIDTAIVFSDAEGKPFMEVDALVLDTMLHGAAEGLDLRTKPDHRLKWIERYADLLTAKLGKKISPAVASFVSKEVSEIMRQLKKTFEKKPTCESSSDTTPATETPSSDDSTTKTCPASPPSANFVNDAQVPG
jgi:hypothetical protein